MVLLLISGITIVYTLRVNMSVAAQKMRDDLDWSEADKGLVLSSFYWGYTVGQLPAARYAQIYGGKWLFGLSVAIPSFLTLLVPFACRQSLVFAVLIRVVIGFFESATFPAVFYFFYVWVPIDEKTFTIPLTVSGMYLGEIVGFSLSGYLASSVLMIGDENYGGWPAIFYVFGLLGIIWFPFWAIFAHESPNVHPTISKEELLHINRGKFEDPNRPRSVSISRALSVGNKHEVISPLMKVPPDSDNNGDLLYKKDTSTVDECGLPYNRVDVHQEAIVATADNGEQYSRVALDDKHHCVDTSNCCESNDNENLKNENANNNDVEDQLAKFPSQPCGNATATTQATATANIVVKSGDRNPGLKHIVQCDDGDYSGNMSSHSISYDDTRANEDRTPWGVFLTHHVALTLLLNQFVYGWIGFTLLSEMPSYLTDVLGFDLQSAGILCVFPYIALFLAALGFGKFFDYMQRNKNWSVRRVRATAQATAYIGSGVGLVVCGFVPQKYVAYGFMVVTQVFYGASQVGIGCVYTDVAPRFSTALNTLGNTCGAMAGILGPLLVAAFVGAFPGEWGWRAAFMLTLVLGICALVMWVRNVKCDIIPELNTPAPLQIKKRG